MTLHHISNELVITRYWNGVKLARPAATDGKPALAVISDMMKKSYNVYFQDREHRICLINEPSWHSCGFQSEQDAINHTMARVCTERQQVMKLHENDRRVMACNQMQVFDELAALKNGSMLHALSFRTPWYNHDNHIIGIFGCSVILHHNGLDHVAPQLTEINNLLLADRMPTVCTQTFTTRGSLFSTREMDVVRLIMRGKTMREIGMQLGLSTRTIESYFVNIKIKAGVTSRSELVDKYYDHVS